MDYILNGKGHGRLAAKLATSNFDVDALRPYEGEDGGTYITINRFSKKEGKLKDFPVQMAPPPRQVLLDGEPVLIGNSTSLRKDEWIRLDRAVRDVAKPRLKAWAALRAASSLVIPNGMGTTVLQYQTMGDITPATISMDGLRQSEEDRVSFDIRNLPLPIIHKDFSYTLREIETSRNGGPALDDLTARKATRRVVEEAEKLCIGVSSTYSYGVGGGTIYGFTNFPDRLTVSLTAPTTDGWTPNTLIREMLAMRQAGSNINHFGPWMVFTSLGWDEYMDEDYSDAKGDNTLRNRIADIEGFDAPMALDYLPGMQVLLVEKGPDTARAVVGMDVNVISWDTDGGFKKNFKVAAIYVPQLFSDNNHTSGIIHGVAA